MKLYYYKAPDGNFGDDLNPWIWNQLKPDLFDDNDDTLFVGIGTLINHRLPKDKKKIIFGSGVGYGKPPIIDDTYNISCVRGPLSAKALKLPSEKAVTDSAMLIKLLNIKLDDNPQKISFMAHCDNVKKANWKHLCHTAGIQYIDSRDSVINVLESLSSTKLLLTEAMHGAIIADALRIPWIPLKLYKNILNFKWEDWCSTLNLNYSPINFPEYWSIERLLPFKEGLKNKTKRFLINTGINGTNWTPPYPKNSSKKLEGIIIKKLESLKTGEDAILSDDFILDNVVSELEKRLNKVK